MLIKCLQCGRSFELQKGTSLEHSSLFCCNKCDGEFWIWFRNELEKAYTDNKNYNKAS